MKNLIEIIANEASPETKKFSRLKVDIRDQVLYLLQNHPVIKNQSDLAKRLNKKDSEISRLLNGIHNITLETIVKISVVLGSDILMTDLRAKKIYANTQDIAPINVQIEKLEQINCIVTYISDSTKPQSGSDQLASMYRRLSQPIPTPIIPLELENIQNSHTR